MGGLEGLMNGHVSRYSDSSLFDEVCVNCGASDGRMSDLSIYGKCPSPGKPYKDLKEYDLYVDRKRKNVK